MLLLPEIISHCLFYLSVALLSSLDLFLHQCRRTSGWSPLLGLHGQSAHHCSHVVTVETSAAKQPGEWQSSVYFYGPVSRPCLPPWHAVWKGLCPPVVSSPRSQICHRRTTLFLELILISFSKRTRAAPAPLPPFSPSHSSVSLSPLIFTPCAHMLLWAAGNQGCAQ